MATSLGCFLLFLFPSVRGPVAFLLFLLANAAFFLSLWISFDFRLPDRARFAMTYLAAASLVHLWAGSLAVQRNGDIVAALLFIFTAINCTAQFFHGIATCLVSRPFAGKSLACDWIDDLSSVGVIVIIVSLTALTGVVAMSRRLKFGYYIWLTLISTCAVSGLWMLIINAIVSVDGYSLYHTEPGGAVWIPLLWPTSFAIAYWFARADAELK